MLTHLRQARMAWGIHRLAKVSLGPAMPNPDRLCRRATPKRPSGHQNRRPAVIFYALGYPMLYGPVRKNARGTRGVWGKHGLPKVSLGPVIAHSSTACGQPTLKRPNGHFKSGHLQVGRPAAVLLPPLISQAVSLW
jgi:hypothetical protein